MDSNVIVECKKKFDPNPKNPKVNESQHNQKKLSRYRLVVLSSYGVQINTDLSPRTIKFANEGTKTARRSEV